MPREGAVTILGARVADGDVELHVDRDIPLEEYRFTRKDDLWWATKDGLVAFFRWEGPGNEGGFEGDDLVLKMMDGSTATLLGPWSSRPGIMNQAGFPPCMEVILLAGDKRWRGYALVSEVRHWVPVLRIPATHTGDNEPLWRAEMVIGSNNGINHVAYNGGGTVSLCARILGKLPTSGPPTCLWCVAQRGASR